MTDPDAIVIGAGPNGLVAANVLADAGWGVLVLEAAPTPGGAVRSAELVAPGAMADVCSSCYPLGFASPVITALGLDRFGLRWTDAPISLAHPTPDGCVAVHPADPDATTASIEAYAPGDGKVWRKLYDRWERAGAAMVDALMAPFPPVKKAATAARHIGLRDIVGFTRMSLWSLDRVCREFDGEGGRLLLGGNTAHTDLSVTSMTGALYGWLLASLAQDVGFPVVEGGAGRLVDALAARLTAGGGEVRCDARVARIDLRDGRAVGVVLADGTPVHATRAVLADTSAPSLYFDLIGDEHLTRRHRRATPQVPLGLCDGQGRLGARRSDPVDRRAGAPSRRAAPRRLHRRPPVRRWPARGRARAGVAVRHRGTDVDRRSHAGARGHRGGVGVHPRAPGRAPAR